MENSKYYKSIKRPVKIIRVRDKIIASDKNNKSGLRGEVIYGTGRHLVHYKDPYGNDAVRTEFDKIIDVRENIVPIGGYQFAFDKLFNIGLDQESTLRIGDLNDEAPQMKIGVQRDEYKSVHYDAECSISNGSMVVNSGVNISAMNFIFGFMMGDGGAKEDNITVIAPNYRNRNLYRAIPFRMSNDGSTIPNGKYFGKLKAFHSTGSDPVTSYYIKKFDDPKPRIVHTWVTNNPKEFAVVDDTVFSSTSSMAIETYLEINLSVDKDDGRGYFTSTDATPRVNEFGLVSGWYNAEKDDYEAIRLFTHFTRPSIALSEGDSIEAIYRLYAR